MLFGRHTVIVTRLRLSRQEAHHQAVGLREQILLGVPQLGVDEGLAALGLPDPPARDQRGVDRGDLAVVDVQERRRLIGRPAAWMTMPNTESNSSGSTPPCTA